MERIMLNGTDLVVKNIRLADVKGAEFTPPEWVIEFEDGEISTYDMQDVDFFDREKSMMSSIRIGLKHLMLHGEVCYNEAQFGEGFMGCAQELKFLLERWGHQAEVEAKRFKTAWVRLAS